MAFAHAQLPSNRRSGRESRCAPVSQMLSVGVLSLLPHTKSSPWHAATVASASGRPSAQSAAAYQILEIPWHAATAALEHFSSAHGSGVISQHSQPLSHSRMPFICKKFKLREGRQTFLVQALSPPSRHTQLLQPSKCDSPTAHSTQSARHLVSSGSSRLESLRRRSSRSIAT